MCVCSLHTLINTGHVSISLLLLGSQISCFPPTNFTMRQAVYVDSFCWVATERQTTEDGSPLWLHKVMQSETFFLTPNIGSNLHNVLIHFLRSHFFLVLSLHPTAVGCPRVCSCSVLALHCCSSALLRPSLYYGGAGSLLQPRHPPR